MAGHLPRAHTRWPRTREITSPEAHRVVGPGQTDSFDLNSGSAWLVSSYSSFKTQLKIITSLGQISYPFPQPLEAVASHLLLIDLSVSPTGLGVPCGRGGQRYPHTWHRRCIQQMLIQLEFQLFSSLLSSLPLPTKCLYSNPVPLPDTGPLFSRVSTSRSLFPQRYQLKPELMLKGGYTERPRTNLTCWLQRAPVEGEAVRVHKTVPSLPEPLSSHEVAAQDDI